jgi:hypothetical protein
MAGRGGGGGRAPIRAAVAPPAYREAAGQAQGGKNMPLLKSKRNAKLKPQLKAEA